MIEKIIKFPSSVDVVVNNCVLTVTGKLGKLSLSMHSLVDVKKGDDCLTLLINESNKSSKMMLGTMVSLIKNILIGVESGFSKSLLLKGVGYRAQLDGSVLKLILGYSHPVEYIIPDDVSISLPNQTEILVQGVDKQRIGQIAADIRSFRVVEPYKGKGIRYSDEVVRIKETKKK